MDDAEIQVRRSLHGDSAFSGWLVRVGDADVALTDINEALSLARKLARSTYDVLRVPVRAADGRWTTDAWAPTDGFVVNGGVRLRF